MRHYDDYGYSARQRREDAAGDKRALIFAAVEDELICEYHEEGGMHSDYKPSYALVNRMVEQRIAAMREHA
jgi:tRNA isopentenyl-2-thiomethyl-A-37 hydroxylase MiaE